MGKYVYLQTYSDGKIYYRYGGEPQNIAFTLTEEEAKHFFKEGHYVKMEIHQLSLPKPKKKKSKK